MSSENNGASLASRPPYLPSRFSLLTSAQSAAFRRLWAARFISFLGDSLRLVALILYVADSVGTGAAVGLLLLVGDLTPTLLSPLTGALADRVDQRRLMVTCELAQGLIMGAIALFLPPLPLVLALVAARSLLSFAFQPAGRSALPELVEDDDLEAANALLGFGTHGLEAGGPLLAALLLPSAGVRGLLAIDAATFLLAVPLLLGLPALPPRSRDAAGAGLFADALAGLRYLWGQPVVRAVAVGFCAVVACVAVDDVALVFLGRETLKASSAGASALYAGSGLGLLAGFALLARRGRRGRPAALLLLGFAVMSAGNLLTGLATAAAVAFGMQVVRGLGGSMIEVGHNTLLQRWVPRPMRARVFANLYGGIGIAAGLSYAIGGPLLDLTSPRIILVAAGTGGLLATIATALMLLPALGRNPQQPAPAGDAPEGAA